MKKLALFSLVLALSFEVLLRLQEPVLHLLSLGDYDSPNNLIAAMGHPIWHHQLRPGLRALEIRVPFDGGLTYELTTNAWGQRYREVQVPKPAGVKRILVLGDSFTAGHVEADTTSVRLEQVLGTGYEVINSGCGGYSPLLLSLRLQGLLEQQPDAVILNVDNTDLYEDWWKYRPQMVAENGVPVAVRTEGWRAMETLKTAMQLSTALRMGVSVAHRLQMELSSREALAAQTSMAAGGPLPTQANIDWFHTADPSDPTWQAAFAFLASNLGRILDLCEARGIRCAITTYPHQGQLDGTQHRHFAEQLGAFARARGVFFYDATAELATAAQHETIFYTEDMHFNPRGFQVWSAAFAPNLEDWAR